MTHLSWYPFSSWVKVIALWFKVHNVIWLFDVYQLWACDSTADINVIRGMMNRVWTLLKVHLYGEEDKWWKLSKCPAVSSVLYFIGHLLDLSDTVLYDWLFPHHCTIICTTAHTLIYVWWSQHVWLYHVLLLVPV